MPVHQILNVEKYADIERGIEVVSTTNDCCTSVMGLEVEKTKQGLC